MRFIQAVGRVQVEVGFEADEQLAQVGNRMLNGLHEVEEELTMKVVDFFDIAEQDVLVVEHNSGDLCVCVRFGDLQEIAFDNQLEFVDIGAFGFDQLIDNVPEKSQQMS